MTNCSEEEQKDTSVKIQEEQSENVMPTQTTHRGKYNLTLISLFILTPKNHACFKEAITFNDMAGKARKSEKEQLSNHNFPSSP